MQTVTPFPAREGRKRVKKDNKLYEKTRICHSGPGEFPAALQVKFNDGINQPNSLTTKFQQMI